MLEMRVVGLRLGCAILHPRLLYVRLLRLGLRPILNVSRVGLRLRLRLVIVAPVSCIRLGLLPVFVMRISSVGLRLGLAVLVVVLDRRIARIGLRLIAVVVVRIPRVWLRLVVVVVANIPGVGLRLVAVVRRIRLSVGDSNRRTSSFRTNCGSAATVFGEAVLRIGLGRTSVVLVVELRAVLRGLDA